MTKATNAPVSMADQLLAGLESSTLLLLTQAEQQTKAIVLRSQGLRNGPDTATELERILAELHSQRSFVEHIACGLAQLDAANLPTVRQRYQDIVRQIDEDFVRVQQRLHDTTIRLSQREQQGLQQVAELRADVTRFVSQLTETSSGFVPVSAAVLENALLRLAHFAARLTVLETTATDLAAHNYCALATAVAQERIELDATIQIFTGMRDAERKSEHELRDAAARSDQATFDALKAIGDSQRKAFQAALSKPRTGVSKNGRRR